MKNRDLRNSRGEIEREGKKQNNNVHTYTRAEWEIEREPLSSENVIKAANVRRLLVCICKNAKRRHM